MKKKNPNKFDKLKFLEYIIVQTSSRDSQKRQSINLDK